MSTSGQNRPNPLLVVVDPRVEETPTTPAAAPAPVAQRPIVTPEKPRFLPHVRNTKRGAPMLKALRPRRRG